MMADDFPSWQCSECGYWNGVFMERCWGKAGCTGKQPAGNEAGRDN